MGSRDCTTDCRPSQIVWSAWGYQNNDDVESRRDGLEVMPLLRFDRPACEAALSTLPSDGA
jgi:hypothetical protein